MSLALSREEPELCRRGEGSRRGRQLTGFTLLLDDCGDYVVVTNARQVVVTGRKADQKLYRHHSGFPGGLKEIPYKTLMENKPEEVCFFRSGAQDVR